MSNYAFSKISENVQELVSSRSQYLSGFKSVGEFLDVRRVSRPENFGEVQSRVRFNLRRFSSNYLAIIAVLAIYCLLTNVLLSIVIGVGAAGVYGIRKHQGNEFHIGRHVYSKSNLYTTLGCVLFPLGLFASPIQTIFWLVGASAVCVLGHGALLEPPVESAFEAVEQQV
ncbi:Rab GTPase binding involved in ER to Golgi vesicle transport Yip3 [Schizosaccharomyces osmophilus]|uniref:PRA1 family protein n=1 Tax=Schizosaccharomyces osmophilus TaxID=2545709 RepID=A0AAF0B016_9SCHI|nr:Rab GTPase binding involved in ER to Golgi vesicle transport Yip3 [Schizosaccharomyces osmophilus]WBW75544.1 Rab GTPase binding involved in ER to Golgi vesicle transport Yip3 [Schizosaccharomyces osmophilus]